MKAYLFPGQGAQYPGMGKDLYETHVEARDLFEQANDILGYRISDTMFEGSAEDLKQTKITQPAIFLHSVIIAKLFPDFDPDMTSGHSLGEFSALVASGCLDFEHGLRLVYARAEAMQSACEAVPSTMAAVIALEDDVVEEVCAETKGIVVAANYNCPGQLVISGEIPAVEAACASLRKRGGRTIMLPVGGAFHSPLMELASIKLAEAIESCKFSDPVCPVYQNVSARAENNTDVIKKNLISQLTAPVKWTQTMKHMLQEGATEFIELGPGKVLQGLIKKLDRHVNSKSICTFVTE